MSMTTCLRMIQKLIILRKNEEKGAPGVENIPTEEEGRPTTVEENQVRPTIHDLSSNTLLSQEEIWPLKGTTR